HGRFPRAAAKKRVARSSPPGLNAWVSRRPGRAGRGANASEVPAMPRYLGIDSSTQSCTGVVIDTDSGEVVRTLSVNYGQDLPPYHSPKGFLYPEDSVVQHSNPLLWVDALELLFARGREAGLDWSSVAGVACSGQQHGSVYLNAGHAAAWDMGLPLAGQVK